MILLSEGNRNAPPAGLICMAVSTAHFMMKALITTVANLRPKECCTKPVPIFVIFSNSNKHRHITPHFMVIIFIDIQDWVSYSMNKQNSKSRLLKTSFLE